MLGRLDSTTRDKHSHAKKANLKPGHLWGRGYRISPTTSETNRKKIWSILPTSDASFANDFSPSPVADDQQPDPIKMDYGGIPERLRSALKLAAGGCAVAVGAKHFLAGVCCSTRQITWRNIYRPRRGKKSNPGLSVLLFLDRFWRGFPFLSFFFFIFTLPTESAMASPGMSPCPAPLVTDPRVNGTAERIDVECLTGSTCVFLAGFTTVLCCPQGGRLCTTIEPITCDLSAQDVANKNVAVQLKTVALQHVLPRCDDPIGRCCPFGYTCAKREAGSACIQNAQQTARPLLAK